MKFQYSCATCGGSVTKKPTGYHKEQYSGLGSWTCQGKCGKNVKVKREKI